VSAADRRDAALIARLASLAAAGLSRRRRLVDSYARADSSVEATIDGRRVRVFCSNDYLGLARHPMVTAAFAAGARRWGAGAGASHLVTGHHAEHHALEEELAEFTGRERAVLFSTGYMANLAVGTVLAGRGDLVLEDSLNHASLLDAGRLAGARFERYAHADAADAARLLATREQGEAVLLTDGLFSMDGDVAPLRELASAADGAGAWLAVDDAHGLGVLGKNGGGSLELCGLGPREVPVLVGTLGKAFGTFGAFVAGSAALCELMVHRARTLIFTTALPPAVAAATREALRRVRNEGWRRERLLLHIVRLRAGCAALGVPLLPSASPIQALVLGDNATALAASEALLERGLLVAAIRPPTVPVGTARLRVTLSAAHTEDDVDRLVEALGALRPVLAR
jgi:8-amino-7-oxononanoate synthase